MLAFLIKRIGNAILVMLTVAFFAFLIFRFLGDPVEMMMNESATQVERNELRTRLGLDAGFFTQYTRFVVNAAQGQFGLSWRNQQDVISLIGERFPATFELVLIATLLSLLIGVPLGVFAAVGRGRIVELLRVEVDAAAAKSARLVQSRHDEVKFAEQFLIQIEITLLIQDVRFHAAKYPHPGYGARDETHGTEMIAMGAARQRRSVIGECKSL